MSIRPLATVKDLKAVLRISTPTLMRQVSLGFLPQPVHVGAGLRWPASVLDDIAEGRLPLPQPRAEKASVKRAQPTRLPSIYKNLVSKCLEVREHPKLGRSKLTAMLKPYKIKKLVELIGREEDCLAFYNEAVALLKKVGPTNA